ncbi:hypothetical protein [Halococcus hamelinensis]|uniref:DUF8009 domain-containing protein n=1 Tax=Halococcus hamelinensis 100A6 TaxID=1132509 RepID=M0LRR3_9EURY|nr:hypothetical protein [Halococcus hamelinensis]EMA36166.1 hypothetical protein C447_15376 [Halococcus hamelinensis 100A6]
MPDDGDYRTIRSIAVHTDDIVTAAEANHTAGPRTVLRVTPPFTPRMRARIHVEHDGEYAGSPAPLHIDPRRLVDAPAYPTPDATEVRLRADPEVEYTVERHHERHTEAVDEWRAALADRVVESVELDGERGPHEVAVAALG